MELREIKQKRILLKRYLTDQRIIGSKLKAKHSVQLPKTTLPNWSHKKKKNCTLKDTILIATTCVQELAASEVNVTDCTDALGHQKSNFASSTATTGWTFLL
jgi:hypothetical protein